MYNWMTMFNAQLKAACPELADKPNLLGALNNRFWNQNPNSSSFTRAQILAEAQNYLREYAHVADNPAGIGVAAAPASFGYSDAAASIYWAVQEARALLGISGISTAPPLLRAVTREDAGLDPLPVPLVFPPAGSTLPPASSTDPWSGSPVIRPTTDILITDQNPLETPHGLTNEQTVAKVAALIAVVVILAHVAGN